MASRLVIAAVGVFMVGNAIGLIDPEEAEKTLALFAEMQAMTGAEVQS